MATTRVNKKDMANNGASYSFDGGVCDCAIVKNIGNSAGVTYGGFAMTKLTELTDFSGATYQIWGLQNAPQGIVTISGMSSINSAESYAGVNTTATFPNTSGTAEHHLGSGSNTNINVDLTTTEDDCILVGLGTYVGSGITYMFPDGGTTLISVNPPSGGNQLSLESNPLQVGVAGVHSMHAATGGGDVNIVISMSVVALTPGAVPSPSFIPQAIIM